MAYKIAVLPGDGIGPEVMNEALKVLKEVEKKFSFKCELLEGLIGGAGYDSKGHPLPEETKKLCLESQAVLLGSIGGPKWDHLPPELTPELGGLLAIRKVLNLYANIRPAVIYEDLKKMSPLSCRVLANKIDFVTVRELAYGVYFGQPKGLNKDEGFDTMRYRKENVEAIARDAFDLAMKRDKRVTSIDKANVLSSSKLWRQVVEEVSKEYPQVTLNHQYVDNAAMQLMLNPSQYDVILTTNLFGDILSDESAAICGSLGMLPSASYGESISLYEPAGGSAPDIAGKNLANPIAQILSLAMMLESSFNEDVPGKAIRNAVEKAVTSGNRTIDIACGGDHISCSEMGDIICKNIREE